MRGSRPRSGMLPSSLPCSLARVRAMNHQFGVPTQVEKLKASDIPEITGKALFEAHLYYAVPRYMDRPECEAFIRQMLPAGEGLSKAA